MKKCKKCKSENIDYHENIVDNTENYTCNNCGYRLTVFLVDKDPKKVVI